MVDRRLERRNQKLIINTEFAEFGAQRVTEKREERTGLKTGHYRGKNGDAVQHKHPDV